MKEGGGHYKEEGGPKHLLELIEVLQGAYFPPGRVADLHEAHKCFGIFSEGKEIEKEEKHPSRSYIMAPNMAPARVWWLYLYACDYYPYYPRVAE